MVATEVRSPGSLDLAQSTPIMVTVNVKNVEEDPSLTLNRLQVRASAADDDSVGGSPVTATVTDPDGPAGDDPTAVAVTWQWFVPKVNRPDLENEDHWIAAGATWRAPLSTPVSVQTPASTCAWLRRTPTGSERTDDKAYARTAHPVAACVMLKTTIPRSPPARPHRSP